MVVLDTDHLSLLEGRASASSNHLRIRLSQLDAELCATTINPSDSKWIGDASLTIPGRLDQVMLARTQLVEGVSTDPTSRFLASDRDDSRPVLTASNQRAIFRFGRAC